MDNPLQNGPRKADVDAVLAEFDSKKDALNAYCERTKGLIDEILQDAGLRCQPVQGRVKARDKLRAKYLDPTKNYKKLSDITDQVAVRIVTYYEDEVDLVAEIINREFEIDPENSIDKREMEPDKFGYSALNYVCRYLPDRTARVEYKKFADIRCEIQITSILRHAWSEIEHSWYDLKRAFPDDIRRRFARMAALLEIAELEFLSLRDMQSQYQRSIAIQVEANVSGLPVDVVSLRSFIEQDTVVADIDSLIARALGGQISQKVPESLVQARLRAASLAGLTTLSGVRESLSQYRAQILEFVRRRSREIRLYVEQSGGTVAKGVSLYVLSLLLVSCRDPDTAAAFVREFEAAHPDANGIVDAARAIMAGR